jgi:hypothetical protein
MGSRASTRQEREARAGRLVFDEKADAHVTVLGLEWREETPAVGLTGGVSVRYECPDVFESCAPLSSPPTAGRVRLAADEPAVSQP